VYINNLGTMMQRSTIDDRSTNWIFKALKEGLINFDGAHDIHTPRALVEEILSKIKLHGDILVMFNIEFVVSLVRTYKIDPDTITFYSDHDNKSEMSRRLGVKYITTLGTDMKFDVVVGNPPYQDREGMENTTTSADLASIFVKKSFQLSNNIVALIIPSDWTGPNSSTLKRFLFKEHTLKKLSFYGNKWFDVKKDTCSFIYDNEYQGPTDIVDVNNTILSLDLTKVDVLSLHNQETAFLQKFNTTSNLSNRWLHGSMNLTEAYKSIGTADEFVCAVGRKGDPITTINITQSKKVVGKGIHKLVVPMVGDMGKLGNVKHAQQHQVGGHSVVFLTADSAAELDSLKSYLESKVIRLLIKSVKKSTPNSKGVFSQIPDISLTQIWSDSDLYAHFHLTPDEIAYIESNVK